MSDKETINPSDEGRTVNAFKYWYETNTEKGVTSIPDYICKGLLDLYNKEKAKNKVIEIYKKDMPKDTELIVMRKEDFDRNCSSEYIHKNKIKETIERLRKQHKNIFDAQMLYKELLGEKINY